MPQIIRHINQPSILLISYVTSCFNKITRKLASYPMEDRSTSLRQKNDKESRILNKSLSVPIVNGIKVPQRTYQETLTKLMEYESNYSVIKKINAKNIGEAKLKLQLIVDLLNLLDISPDDLNKLNVIHVAGTKGKGSTCAYIDTILTERGYKTGLFTSPHLISVRERIRLSGKPISIESFIKYFWEVHSILSSYPEKPGYFMFLTILCFHIFRKENVDFLILETGIGGEYDCTNIVPKPIATGITSLGIDHTSILGDTLESIAWHKAGILKPGVACFTVFQEDSANQMIKKRAAEKGCPILTCPSLESYSLPTKETVQLGIDSQVQRVNASLALQIARHAHNILQLQKNQQLNIVKPSNNSFTLEQEEIDGLLKTRWPGRCQIITRGRTVYYLDGAHTVESMENCLNWFKRRSHEKSGDIFRVLLFFSAGQRQYEPLIKKITEESFDQAIFPANRVDQPEKYPEMIVDSRYDSGEITERITKTKELWKSIQADKGRDNFNCLEFSSLTQALQFLESDNLIEGNKDRMNDKTQIHVLVTGSLLFVGNVLTIIDSNMIASSS